MIRPLPDNKGCGFFSREPQPHLLGQGYTEQTVGSFHNFLFNARNWKWPKTETPERRGRIDGFSPNLNKQLHVGHLRNLAIANAFSKLAPNYEFVALLGTSLGVRKEAQLDLEVWFHFLDYRPRIYYDAIMPWDDNVVPRQPGTGQNQGALVWINPQGNELIVARSTLQEWLCRADEAKEHGFYLRTGPLPKACPTCGSSEKIVLGRGIIPGRPNYIFHDIAFAATVAPDKYITGTEQREHFRDLGLAERHLPMGLVCGPDGKKLKSRTGDALSAQEAVEMVQSRLNKTDSPRCLAWNVLCWNFLHCSREQNVRFDPEQWTNPDSPGLYITYTYARIVSALSNKKHFMPDVQGPDVDAVNDPENLTDLDVRLLGYSQYSHYWIERTLETWDTAPLANYVHDFCRELAYAYNQERIIDGRPAFRGAILLAAEKLRTCMTLLGMFPLVEV